MSEPHFFPDAASLERFGEELAPRLPVGSVLVLIGPLGAGKTTLARGLARGLASSAQVTSPTYGLIHEYPTPEGVFAHIDAYRLTSPRELWGLGLEELTLRARLVAIEWGEGLIPELEHPVVIRIEPDANGRRLVLELAETN